MRKRSFHLLVATDASQQARAGLAETLAFPWPDGARAQGVMVTVEGEHMCASMRGVKKHGASMVTTARRGSFRKELTLRDEFYRLIDHK